jgi:hypothetical protein
MMSRAVLILDTPERRERAARWCLEIGDGTRVEFSKPKRTNDQNKLMWVLLTHVANQKRYHGVKLAADDWKLLFMDALSQEMRIMPSLDGERVVSLRSSSDLRKDEMSDLIEIIYAWGAREGVCFD